MMPGAVADWLRLRPSPPSSDVLSVTSSQSGAEAGLTDQSEARTASTGSGSADVTTETRACNVDCNVL